MCFPWFGDKADNPAAPAHGFVRTTAWSLESIEQLGEDVGVSMFTESSEDTRAWWPFDFRIVCRATFGTQLKLELIVTNSGAVPLAFEEALHAYFAVGDVQLATISGLDATRFIDKVDHLAEKTQSGDLRLSSEIDRVYLNTRHDIDLIDRLLVGSSASQGKLLHHGSVESLVQKSAAMRGPGAGQWKHFVCIETSNVGTFAVRLGPGETHTMTSHIRCE